MKFIPRESLILLRVTIPEETPKGIEIIESMRKVDFDIPLEVVAVYGKSYYKVGDSILLDEKPIDVRKKNLFPIPGDDGLYVLLPEYYIGGKLEDEI